MEEPWDSTVSQVSLGLVQLRKLKPSLSREESCNLLAECCHTILSFPSKEEMEGRGKTARQTRNIQTLHMLCLEGLGRIIVALLEAEVTSTCFEDVVHVLQCWLASAKAWERERALQVCAQLLGDCEERFEVMVSRELLCAPCLSLSVAAPEESPAWLGAGFQVLWSVRAAPLPSPLPDPCCGQHGWER
ncbi:maestro heat-like repeat-containing protein family member 2B [Morphnus guianensis]